MNIWQLLASEHTKYPEDFGSGCNEGKIREMEKFLNLSLSDTYKKFLLLYSAAVVPGHILYGAYPINAMDIGAQNVVEKTDLYKKTKKWPGIEDWYIISDDGRGNPIGCKPDGSVWLSDHDAGFEQVKLADDFERFLEKILNNTLYED
jgi:hypothetical protein